MKQHFTKKLPSPLAQKVVECCRELEPKFPRVWAWVQSWANKNGHPGALIYSLEGYKKITTIDAVCIKSPWAYCDSIMRTKNGNYHEADHIKKSQDKVDVKEVHSEIKALIKGMF